MPREIISHVTNIANERIALTAVDERSPAGANHKYEISFPLQEGEDRDRQVPTQHIHFQNGPIAESGVNGTTHEVLLAVVEDRLVGFQAGPYACPENEAALQHVRDALQMLKRRTRDREARGVEGTHTI